MEISKMDRKKIILLGMLFSMMMVVGCSAKVMHLIPAEELAKKKVMEIMKDKELSDEEKLNYIQLKMIEESQRKKSAVEIEKDQRMRGLIQKPVTPLRTPDTILRVLILPYEDDNGVLNGWKYSYIKVEDGKWVLADYLNSSLPSGNRVLTPLDPTGNYMYSNSAPQRRIVADTEYGKAQWYEEKKSLPIDKQKKVLEEEWANLEKQRKQLEKEREMYEKSKIRGVKTESKETEIEKEEEMIRQDDPFARMRMEEEERIRNEKDLALQERLRKEEAEHKLKEAARLEEERKKAERKAMIDNQLREIEAKKRLIEEEELARQNAERKALLEKAQLEFMHNELTRANKLEEAMGSGKDVTKLKNKLDAERAKDLLKLEKIKNGETKTSKAKITYSSKKSSEKENKTKEKSSYEQSLSSKKSSDFVPQVANKESPSKPKQLAPVEKEIVAERPAPAHKEESEESPKTSIYFNTPAPRPEDEDEEEKLKKKEGDLKSELQNSFGSIKDIEKKLEENKEAYIDKTQARVQEVREGSKEALYQSVEGLKSMNKADRENVKGGMSMVGGSKQSIDDLLKDNEMYEKYKQFEKNNALNIIKNNGF